jgi:predicted XRE-type DNA-binding protein
MKIKHEYMVSSGNVFEDLELENPEECLAKAELARQINNLIKQKGFTQKEAAQMLGVTQPKISSLSKGRVAGFSLEKLFRFLNILGHNITIQVSQTKVKNDKARVSVTLPKLKKQIPAVRQIGANTVSVQERKKR